MKAFSVIAICVLMLAALSLAGCGGGSSAPVGTEAPTAAPTEAPTEAPTSEPTAAPTEAPDPVAESVERFAGEYSASLEALREAFSGVMDVDCYAEGRNFVLAYMYADKFQSTPELLRRSLDETAASYVGMFEELAAYAGSEEVAVVLRYLDSDGSLILDYIIDSEYAEVASALPADGTFASLEEFINSDVFIESMSDEDDDQMRTEYSVENGDTFVITYRYLIDMTDQEKELFADLMYEAMEDEGDELIAEMKDLVLSAVDIDDCGVVFRVADKDGNILTQYPQDEN